MREWSLGKRLTSSGYVTADGVRGLLHGYCLLAGTELSSVTFYDGGASGTARWKDSVKLQTAAGDDGRSLTFPKPIKFEGDIYATLAGSGATLSVCYEEID